MTLASCGEKVSVSYPEPDQLIEKVEFVEILTELTFLESAYQVKYVQVTRYSHLLQQQSDSIFRVFKTDRNSFEESMEYYAHHQEQLAEIYELVKANLEKRKEKLSVHHIDVNADNNQQKITLDSNRVMTEEDLGQLNSPN